MVEETFGIIQVVTYAVIAVLIVLERRSEATEHRFSLQLFWIASFLIYSLFVVSGLLRLVTLNHDAGGPDLRLNDMLSFISFALSVVLLVVCIRGSTGIMFLRREPSLIDDGNSYSEPLLENSFVSDYANASVLSKVFWLWMNPLLSKGYRRPLAVNDVPSLSPEHGAEKMSILFQSKWPKPHEECKNPVRTTLFRCFWKEMAFTAFLALVRICVMFVGPSLIHKFIDFTSGVRSSPYEGYYLVLVLLIGKVVEVLTSHQFNFHSQKLGMLICSTLVTNLYKKGLKLSCSARQTHGVGQIVNYMAVDAQQLSDMMLQLHAIWQMPLQVCVTLILLYNYIGAAAITALIGILGVLLFMLFCMKRDRKYQYYVMKNRDSRMKATNEMLNYMRVIKFQAWEEHFNKRIQSFRDSEFKWLAKFLYSFAANMVVLWSLPLVVSTLTFGTAILLGVSFDAATVFTTTTLFKMLQEPIRTFPQSMVSISQAVVSLARLDDFMTSRELVEESVERIEGYSTTAVEVRDGFFSWDDEGGEEVLKNISLNINKGQLAAIVGTVGSGKSSLLASILGEMHKTNGKVRVCGTTAYVAQTSWIQNGTIQQNILFGLPMNQGKYREVVRVCCLEKDLEMMEFGDETEIGERGINLSGGQKQRIQLARAVYQDCDIYLLDDVFSAVDAHTGSQIFKECVRGALRDKTVILVTHQVDFLHNVDLILVMRDGTIVQGGKYDNLSETGTDFHALVAAHETSMELVEGGTSDRWKDSHQHKNSPKALSSHGEVSRVDCSITRSNSEKGDSRLIKEEERETGKVSLHIYKVYCTEAFGWWGLAAGLLFSLSWQSSIMAADYWLAYETSAKRASSFDPSFFITIYSIIAAISIILVFFRSFFIMFFGMKTAQIFFTQILHNILHAPMSFFDTTPSGRILSRDYYLSTSRELTRLDSITKAPVIHHFSESILGFMTIRCFRKQENFIQENVNRVNMNLRMEFHNNGSNEWLGFRLELLGSLLLCISTLFMILLPSSIIKPENVGLSLSYGLSLNSVLFWAIYMSCFVENRMVSVERIKQFTEIPSEAEWTFKDPVLPPTWPAQGNIELKNLQVRYRINTPLVLKGITLGIKGGEKVGVVGRTGSGKSTLIQVFFRLIEPSAGRIAIDNIDISMVGLHDLRSRFGIIPQEPVLFEGTIRSNIDPTSQYSEDEIWKSLERCQLKDVVTSKPEKLDAPVVDNGDNWSVGQRQLLCLGRVMLKKSRVLFMDEATASVDSQTDAVIQKIIREDFADCTIISIAHRIPTVMDCDRVLVIDAGKAKEYDSPSQLLARPSLFGALVQEYANRSSGF
ncbi:hypothetical protein SOVF_051440 [Spinacia oleracea]|nr:hypothetical protein SOVF_051440 [Spinacia oleracea]